GHGSGGVDERKGGRDCHVQLARFRARHEAVWNSGLVAGRGHETIGEAVMRKSNFALRLQPSLLDEARKLAEEEGVALNQLINVAVAEKVSALRTESYLAERNSGSHNPNALRILMHLGL